MAPAENTKAEPCEFCKPDSVHPSRGWVTIFLAPRAEARRALPKWQSATNTRGTCGGQGSPPPVCLASRGACQAPVGTFGAVGSYPTFSPLPLRAVYFLWRYPSLRLEPKLPRCHEARCLTMSGLSSTSLRLQRPPGLGLLGQEHSTASVNGKFFLIHTGYAAALADRAV